TMLSHLYYCIKFSKYIFKNSTALGSWPICPQRTGKKAIANPCGFGYQSADRSPKLYAQKVRFGMMHRLSINMNESHQGGL
ncbi:MAG: hypothetical protein KKD16_03610, partial [Proteobacteria bacterium]|nr:hypothetical protein [Pseudomonadota bacterium]